MAAPSCGKCIKARPGQRVVRGPDWWGGDEDGGIDHVGTVVSVFEPETGIGYASHPIQVKWDAGPLQCYRACCTSGTCDLRLIDAGPSGVTFLNITCCYCETKGVTGTLWKCAECADYNLCHPCYMMDKHNVEHEFFRYDDTSSKGFRVPARKKSTKVPFYGIFLGAEVQSHGAVKNDIVANVRGKARLLRKTDDGKLYYNNSDKVDESLKYIKKACGGNYYRDHMPAIASPGHDPKDLELFRKNWKTMSPGDTVQVIKAAEQLERLQSTNPHSVLVALRCHGGFLEASSLRPKQLCPSTRMPWPKRHRVRGFLIYENVCIKSEYQQG